MPSSERDETAIEYIRANRLTYSRDQIHDALVAGGYEPSAIESYWAGIEEGESAAGREREAKRVQAEERDLRNVTKEWTVPIVVRTYDSNKKGEAAFAAEATILARHQYQPSMQSAEGSHLHAGRLLLTGGLSVFAGGRGIRSKGKLTVTYQQVAASPAAAASATPDPMDQIRKLAELRDAGILTTEEFDTKKAEILSRM